MATRAISASGQMAVVEEVQKAEPRTPLRRGMRSATTGTRLGINGINFEMKVPENMGRIAAQTAKQVILQKDPRGRTRYRVRGTGTEG
ncbi:MAG: hypothetical protein H6676_05580 [Thermoflexaceae bacterium]|nr:hypothetical protein [Thermoflexaceae bacterium]